MKVHARLSGSVDYGKGRQCEEEERNGHFIFLAFLSLEGGPERAGSLPHHLPICLMMNARHGGHKKDFFA